MIVMMKSGTPLIEIEAVMQALKQFNVQPEKLIGKQKVVIGLIGATESLNIDQIQQLSPAIEQVLRVKQPFKRASLEFRYGEPSEVHPQCSRFICNSSFTIANASPDHD